MTNTQSQYTPQALNSARRLNIILDSLMPLVTYTKSSYRKKNINIVEIFEDVMSDFKDQIESKNITVATDFPASIWKYMDV